MIFDSEQFFYHHPGIEHAFFGIAVPVVETYMRFRPDDARPIGFLTRAVYLDAAYTGQRPWFADRVQGSLREINSRKIETEVDRGIKIHNTRRVYLAEVAGRKS